MDKPPFLSVIIAVRNEERFIGRTLNQISQQNYPRERYEIILIDGLSEDQTISVAEGFKDKITNLHILSNPDRLASSGRNIGLQKSRGEYIIVIDGHVYIENRNLFRDMIDIFASTGLQTLSRPQPLMPPDNSRFQNAIAYARESIIGHGLDSTIYNMKYEGAVSPASSGAMYRRSVFEQAGSWDGSFDAAEDFEFNYRLSQSGFKSYISPRLAVYYYPRDSLKGLFRQMHRYGLGRFRLLKKHKTISSGVLILPLFYLVISLFAMASLFIQKLWYLPVTMAAAYLAAILFASLAIGFRKGLRYLCFLPMIYLTLHFGLTCGFLTGFFKSFARKHSHIS